MISRTQHSGEVRQIQSLIVRGHSTLSHPTPNAHASHPHLTLSPSPPTPMPRLAVTLPSTHWVTAHRGSLCWKSRAFLRCLPPHVFSHCTTFTARTGICTCFLLCQPRWKNWPNGRRCSLHRASQSLGIFTSVVHQKPPTHTLPKPWDIRIKLTEVPSGEYFIDSLCLPENERSTVAQTRLVTLRGGQPQVSDVRNYSGYFLWDDSNFFLAQTYRTQSDFFLSESGLKALFHDTKKVEIQVLKLPCHANYNKIINALRCWEVWSR